jgi:hypothetical protein
MAVKMNVADAIPSLRQNLNEEEEMFGWLRANAPAMFAKLWPQIEGESSSLNLESSSSSPTPATTQDQQQQPATTQDQQQQEEEDDEKFKGGSTTRHRGHLTVTTEAVSERANNTAYTVAERRKDQKRHKTTRKKGKGQ